MALIAGARLVMLLIFLMLRGSLIDDAYIALDYARNLALHLHWGLIPHEVANTATSPLNTILLATVTAASRIGGWRGFAITWTNGVIKSASLK